MILYKLGLVDVEVETNVIVEESGAPSRAKELHYSNAPDNSPINIIDVNVIAAEPKVGASQSVVGVYSAETFAIAVVVACFASLIVGFLSGLMFSRRCKLEEYSGGFNGAPYLEQRRLSRLNETMTAHQNIEPSKMNNFIDNQPTSLVKMANEKNSNAVTTLDMKPVQKVKKTYVWASSIILQTKKKTKQTNNSIIQQQNILILIDRSYYY